jgi:hypothetical protein
MPTLDPRVDAYITGSPDFAQPILAGFKKQTSIVLSW